MHRFDPMAAGALSVAQSEALKMLNSFPTTKGSVALEQIHPTPKLSEWPTLASAHAIQSRRSEITSRPIFYII